MCRIFQTLFADPVIENNKPLQHFYYSHNPVTITIDEIKQEVTKLKNRKFYDLPDIYNELFQYSNETLIVKLYELVDDAINMDWYPRMARKYISTHF